jgi:hypothetical protein
MNLTKLVVPLLAVTCFAAACGGDEEEDLAAEGCEHLKEGPMVAVTAAADTTGAPAIAADHKRYDVSVAATGGYVSFASSQTGHLLVFLGTDVGVALTNAAGQPVAASETTKTGFPCSELKAAHEFEVGVGMYNLKLTPAAAGTVSVVLET